MLTKKIKALIIAAASLVPVTGMNCPHEPDGECRSVGGCQCVAGDCEEEPSLPAPG